LPVLEGVIARRVLLNFRADPALVQSLLPQPLLVQRHRAAAIVGICLIRLEHLRPKGMPELLGVAAENMAHRAAILYPAEEGMRPGVFVWRRDTNLNVVHLLGGRAFPGIHQRARFLVQQRDQGLAMTVRTRRGEADVAFHSATVSTWRPTPAFDSMAEASDFFRAGECGFSCSRRGNALEGLRLKSLEWEMSPLRLELERTAFFLNPQLFPRGSVEFDSALLMQHIAHEWHVVPAPEAETVTAPSRHLVPASS
jgi:hypothetical protein